MGNQGSQQFREKGIPKALRQDGGNTLPGHRNTQDVFRTEDLCNGFIGDEDRSGSGHGKL